MFCSPWRLSKLSRQIAIRVKHTVIIDVLIEKIVFLTGCKQAAHKLLRTTHLLAPLLLVEYFLHVLTHFHDLVIFQIKLIVVIILCLLYECHTGLVMSFLMQITQYFFGTPLAEATRTKAAR